MHAQIHEFVAAQLKIPGEIFYTRPAVMAPAMLQIQAEYGLDVPSITYDVNNIEAEALGQRLIFTDANMADVAWSAPLLALVATTLFAQFFGGSAHGVTLVRDIDAMTNGMLALHIPQIAFDRGTLELLIVSGAAVALLGLVEAMSVAKSLAFSTGQTIDASREFMGQGSPRSRADCFRAFRHRVRSRAAR